MRELKSKILIASLLVAAATGLAVAGAENDLYTGPQTAYRVLSDGSFFGQKMHASIELTVKKNASDYTVTQRSIYGAKDATVHGRLGADGAIEADSPPSSLLYTNAVAQLLSKAPAVLDRGAHWRASVSMLIAPGSFLSVPVDVSVATKSGNQVEIQAVGSQTGTMSYAALSFPIRLEYRSASVVANGKLLKSISALTMTSQSGSYGSSHWQVTVTPDGAGATHE